MTCEGCGLPSDVCSGMHLHIRTRTRPDAMLPNRPPDKSATVWVCGKFCAWQTLAIASMGKDTSKWPIRFKEFISANSQLLERSIVGQTVTKPLSQLIEKSTTFNAKKTRLVYQHGEPSFVTLANGRPRNHTDNAARQRAYRNRKRQNT